MRLRAEVEARSEPAAAQVGQRWSILGGVTDEPLGQVTLGRPSAAGSAEIDFWLAPQARGRGVIQQALDVLIPVAFGDREAGGLGLRRLAAKCEFADRPAERTLRRAGFRRIGATSGTAVRLDAPGSPVLADEELFELLAADDRQAQRVTALPLPPLQTAGLRLREWRESDRPDAADGPDRAALTFMPPGAQASDENYDEWLPRRRRQSDRAEAINWCIADRANDRALGSIGVFTRTDAPIATDAEIGYWVFPRARGNGVLSEAITAVIDYCFRSAADGGLGLLRLHATTDSPNVPSRAVLRRAGFRQWGHAHGDYVHPDGSSGDSTYFELLAGDRPAATHPSARLGEPTLEGLRVRLRRWADADRARIVEACRDATTQRWLAQLPRDYTDADALAYLAECHEGARSGSALNLAVADVVSDEAIGSICVGGVHQPLGSGEIGYWAHPGFRGRGLITEAVGLVVRHSFAPAESGGLGLERLSLHVADGNDASARVATANGFSHQGVQRRAHRLGDGEVVDLHDYDLLVAQFDPRSDVRDDRA